MPINENFINSPAMQVLRESKHTGRTPKDAVFRNGKWERLDKPYEPKKYKIIDPYGNRVK